MNKAVRRTILGTAVFALIVAFATTPAGAQGTIIATDNFDRADESPFSPTGNWARTIAGNYDGFSLLVNSQVHSASNEGIYYWQGAGTFSATRQFARERVVQKDGEVGLVLLGGADQAIMIGWGPPGVGSTVYIYWYSGGIDRGQLATGPSSLVNGDIIEAVLDGGTIYAKVNGTTVLSVANTTTLTSGKPGFITYLNPGLPGEVAIMDDWEAGTPSSYTISGTITEDAAGLSGVLVTASGGFGGNATTNGNGEYTMSGIPANATSIVLTPTLAGHTMSPLSRNVAGPVTADVAGQDFTSTAAEEPPPDVVAADDFNRADEIPLTVGGNWQQAIAGGTANLSGNHAVGGTADAVYYWQGAGTFDNARQYARLKVDNAGGQVGLVLLGSSGKALVVSWNAGTLYIYWYTGGSIQTPLTTVSSTLQNGDVIEALLDGGIVYAKRNGTVIASVANTTTLNAGRPGFETFQAGAAFDDWEAGTPQSYTISGTVTEDAAGLSGVLVTASGGFVGSATTNGSGTYTITGVPNNATSILLTPALAGHTMSPLTRTVAGPVTANVTGEDFTSTEDAEAPPGGIASDNFDRANETPLAVGGNWTQPFGGGSVNLTGNHVASAGGEALYYWQGAGTFDNTRQYARAHVLQAGGQVGMVLLGAPNQALVVSWGGGRLYIYWYLNGTHHGELVNMPMTLNDGDEIEGLLDHGVIYAKINGVVVRSVANTTSLTSGRPGFETYLTGASFDDWEAGTPPSYSISGTITESAAGLGGVLVTASGGFIGSATTNASGEYTIEDVPAEATSIALTPSLLGHTMSPLSRTVAGPVTADVAGQDFTSTFVATNVVASDDFNRANETPLAVGGNWQLAIAGGSANLTGNHGVGVSADAVYFWQGGGTFDNARQFSRLKVDNAGGQVGLVLLGAPNQALVVSWNAGNLYIYWYTGGSIQTPLTVVPSTLQNGDVIEARLEGGTISARRNGVLVASAANTTTLTSGRPGLETYQSGAAFDDWQAGVDATPPAISAVVATPSANSANVTWNTDEAATSRVDYGTDAGALTSSSTSSVLETAHSLSLTPLNQATTYYYRVSSADGVGNASTEPAPPAAPASFTTPALDLVAAAPAPGSAITTITSCVSVPVVFTRVDATPLLGYSVTVELSANLSLCGAQIASAGYPQAPRQFVVTALGGNRWTVDEVTLGSPCGTSGSGTLFTLNVSSAIANGTGTITVLAATARDCSNLPIPAYPGAPAVLPIDREGPAQTADLVATQLKTGNYVAPPGQPHGTTPVRLVFTVPPDAAQVQVYRRPFGGYPQYDENGGAAPSAPSSLPGAGWTLTAVTASNQTDEPAARDYWYYALVARDAYGNPSLVSNLTAGTLNYDLGDVSTGFATCAGDDRVTVADLSYLGSHYGITAVPVNDPLECLDFGPTTDFSVDGRPLTDNTINFEDLIMLALNFGEVSAPELAGDPRDKAGGGGNGERLAIVAPTRVSAGELFDARVDLHAGGRLHGLSVALEWDRAVAEPLAVRTGGFVEKAGGVTYAAGPAALDGAVLGAAQSGLTGEGAYAIVQFRALADGDPAIRLGRVLGRDGRNQPVVIDDAQPAPIATAAGEVRLLPAAPSPFTSETTIRYTLAVDAHVELVVFGIDGRRVRTLHRGSQPAGLNRVTWDGTDDHGRAVGAGVYFARLIVGANRYSQLITRLAR